MRQVVARAALGLRKRQFELSLHKCGKKRFLLRFGPTTRDKLSAETNGCQIRFYHQSFADRLHHRHQVNGITAETSVLVSERQAEQSHLSKSGPNLLAVACCRGKN